MGNIVWIAIVCFGEIKTRSFGFAQDDAGEQQIRQSKQIMQIK